MKPLQERDPKEIKIAIRKLKDALEATVGVKSAITFAGISQEDYDNLARMHPEISKLAEEADSLLGTQASINIKNAIVEDKDVKTSMWRLEKTDPKYSKKVQVDGTLVSAEEREKAIEKIFDDLD